MLLCYHSYIHLTNTETMFKWFKLKQVKQMQVYVYDSMVFDI